MKFVTIIPARGGSKRFPGKNIHNLKGKPLISLSIDYSTSHPLITGTYVTTDDETIKSVSCNAGAEIIDRPAELADDYATTAAAMKHAVQCLIDRGVDFDYVVLLQATNPLRPEGLLDEAINIIEQGHNDSLFTVNRSTRKLGKIQDGKFVPWNYHFGQRSQDLEPLYYENGLLYITRKDLLLQEIIEGPTAYPLVVEHPFGEVDIDTEEDFHFAEYMLDEYGTKGPSPRKEIKTNDVIDTLRGGMIVSCQSEGDDPFNENPEYMALFARAAVMGGAVGIRTQGIEKLKSIKRAISLPVMGLLKSQFSDGTVRITGSFAEVEQLIAAGSDIVAIDGTFREREGLTGPAFIAEVKRRYSCLVLADIATFDEAKACQEAGADAISTTLNGYTPNTLQHTEGPNYDVLRQCIEGLTIPVFAEGRYNTPAEAGRAMQVGAFAVISGTAITRPRVVTNWFVNEINKNK